MREKEEEDEKTTQSKTYAIMATKRYEKILNPDGHHGSYYIFNKKRYTLLTEFEQIPCLKNSL